MSDWLRCEGDGNGDALVLTLHIQPGAKKTEVVGLHGEALKIRLAAPPVDGKANAALLDFLRTKVSRCGTAQKPTVTLISGDTSRAKRVRIDGIDAQQLRTLLLPA